MYRDGWCPGCGRETGYAGNCHACVYVWSGGDVFPDQYIRQVRKWAGRRETIMSIHTIVDARPEHSEFGGSVAYRVKHCAGSVALLRRVLRKTSEAADEGTWAHALAAYCLQQGYRTADAFVKMSLPISVEVPPQYSGQVCGEAMVAAVNLYLAEVFYELDLSPDAELYIEEDFDLPVGAPGEVFGRADATVWHPSLRRLRTLDYKHGVGTLVDVEDNDQALFYTAGALHKHPDWKPLEVVITVVQPRPWEVAAGTMEAVRDCYVEAIDVALWLADYGRAVQAAKDPAAPCVAGPWCDKTFCDARAVCPAREALALAQAQAQFASVRDVTAEALPAPSLLDVEQLSRIAQGAKLLAAYANQCEEYLLQVMMSQNIVATEHFKIVDKVARAKWVEDQAKVYNHCAMMFGLEPDQVMPRKLVTITDMVARLKVAGASKADLDSFKLAFTVKESSGRTIAPVTDRRPAVDPVAADFASVKPITA